MPGFKSFKKGIKTIGILKSIGTLKVKNLLRKLDKEKKDIMGHILKKSEKKKVTVPRFSSAHQKIARLHSGNTITAQKLLRKLDKENGTKNK